MAQSAKHKLLHACSDIRPDFLPPLALRCASGSTKCVRCSMKQRPPAEHVDRACHEHIIGHLRPPRCEGTRDWCWCRSASCCIYACAAMRDRPYLELLPESSLPRAHGCREAGAPGQLPQPCCGGRAAPVAALVSRRLESRSLSARFGFPP